MRKIISISLLSILLLSSCSIDWNDENIKKVNEQNEKISKLEKQIEDYKKEKEDDLFKKKQECSEYYTNAVRYYSNDINGPFEIFYSPIKNTCYVSFQKKGILPADYNPNDPVNPVTPMVIIDWFTKKEYFITFSNEPLLEEKIKELKGE